MAKRPKTGGGTPTIGTTRIPTREEVKRGGTPTLADGGTPKNGAPRKRPEADRSTVQVKLRLPPKVARKFEILADASGVTRSVYLTAIVRAAFRKYLESRKL